MVNLKKADWTLIVLFILELFNGASGLLGGFILIIDPTGVSLGLPIEWLEPTPFVSYLIPGIILFSVNGLGNIGGAAFTLFRYRKAGEVAIVLGIIMMGWIVSQVILTGYQGVLQPVYFSTGLVQALLGLMYRGKQET